MWDPKCVILVSECLIWDLCLMWGAKYMMWDPGCRIWGPKCRMWDPRHIMWDSRCMVWDTWMNNWIIWGPKQVMWDPRSVMWDAKCIIWDPRCMVWGPKCIIWISTYYAYGPSPRSNINTLWSSCILLWLEYFSNILWMSGWTPDVQLCVMAAAFFHYRTPCAQFGQVFRCFPFCYDSNTSLIYHGCPTPCDGCSIFSLSDNSHPIQLSVLMFFLFIMFHPSFFQIYFRSYLAYLISDISQCRREILQIYELMKLRIFDIETNRNQ